MGIRATIGESRGSKPRTQPNKLGSKNTPNVKPNKLNQNPPPSGPTPSQRVMARMQAEGRESAKANSAITNRARENARRQNAGNGNGGGGDPGGGIDIPGNQAPPYIPPPPVVKPPNEKDYLAGDDIYTNTIGALQRALKDYQAQYTADSGAYGIDYGNALKSLGYTPGLDPSGKGGSWNWDDPLTASGNARQRQTNDFAGRGMLQSSGYNDSFDTLKRSLNDQFEGMLGAKNKYMGDLDRGLTNYKSQNTSASQNARAEAMARMAALYGLV